MFKMKKLLFNICAGLFVAASALMTGCSKYIDINPEVNLPADKADYSNTSQMYMPVSGVYATSNNSFSFWAGQGLIAVRGDDMSKGGSPTDQIEFSYCKNFQYDRIVNFWALNSAWQGLYGVVNYANNALIALEGYAQYLTTDEQKKLNQSYTAEVRFLRAYAYFRISNFWGDAPLVLSNEIAPKKAGLQDIRKFILTEMDYCVDNLPAIRPNERTDAPGAVTKYTALALKAKVQLYMQDYAGVITSTDEIINSNRFQLYSSFSDLFKIPGKLSNESLYELQFTDFGAGSGNIVESDAWFAFQGPAGQSFPSYISGWGFMSPTDETIAFFKGRGESVRAQTTFLYAGQKTAYGDTLATAQTGMPTVFNGKAYTPSVQMTAGRTNYGANNNIRILRYADVLLMNAEAKVRQGQSGDAPLNEVRKRAQLADLHSATLQDVLDERRAEFANEWGERFFDLVRTDKAQTLLPGFVKGQSEFYPIPQNQVDLNPNLK